MSINSVTESDLIGSDEESHTESDLFGSDEESRIRLADERNLFGSDDQVPHDAPIISIHADADVLRCRAPSMEILEFEDSHNNYVYPKNSFVRNAFVW